MNNAAFNAKYAEEIIGEMTFHLWQYVPQMNICGRPFISAIALPLPPLSAPNYTHLFELIVLNNDTY